MRRRAMLRTAMHAPLVRAALRPAVRGTGRNGGHGRRHGHGRRGRRRGGHRSGGSGSGRRRTARQLGPLARAVPVVHPLVARLHRVRPPVGDGERYLYVPAVARERDDLVEQRRAGTVHAHDGMRDVRRSSRPLLVVDLHALAGDVDLRRRHRGGREDEGRDGRREGGEGGAGHDTTPFGLAGLNMPE